MQLHQSKSAYVAMSLDQNKLCQHKYFCSNVTVPAQKCALQLCTIQVAMPL